MKIALLGGTGDMGEGLALRWAKNHEIIIGSREALKGARAAADYLAKAKTFYGDSMKGSIKGTSNPDAAAEADIIVLTIPHEFAASTIVSIKDRIKPSQILVSPVVPMVKTDKAMVYSPVVKNGRIMSYAEALAEELRDIPIVAAYHAISAKKLANPSAVLNYDVPIAGDDMKAVEVVIKLTQEIPNLRPVYVGPLRAALMIEALTPLIINAAIFSKIRDASIAFIQ
ncbi:MAG: NADPH-dependent F420 reductase [Nitrososphaerota archaeon]|nr:NADPH-dependent F420 reductase [Candidatus Nezhaarchaeota archaeon]MDW8050006.1 NADPH-dependent F420 reductase [Nitrososphaerota archaeon]